MTRTLVIPLLGFLVLSGSACPAGDCLETAVIDSVQYAVTDFWCGKALDSAQIAMPEQLVPLPQQLTFEDYRIYVLPQTCEAFVKMAEAARRDSIELIADSGFRSPAFQRSIIRRRMEKGDRFEKVLESVAPPGYSEHHTGRTLDLCPSEARFAFSDAYHWLKEHAPEYGFFETLPEDPAAPLTWESWHWTYLDDSVSSSVRPPADSADNQ